MLSDTSCQSLKAIRTGKKVEVLFIYSNILFRQKVGNILYYFSKSKEDMINDIKISLHLYKLNFIFHLQRNKHLFLLLTMNFIREIIIKNAAILE